MTSKKPKIFDCFIFFNELDLLEIRLNYLNNFVDYFVIVESKYTFNGQTKEIFFNKNCSRFIKFKKKILHYVVEDLFDCASKKKFIFSDVNKSLQFKHNGVPIRKLKKIFQQEIYQRDSIIIPLSKKASSSDYILLSDIDEIPDRRTFSFAKKMLNKFDRVDFQMKWHLYYFNLVKKNKWFGTRMFKFNFLTSNNRSVDSMRYPLENIKLLKNNGGTIIKSGWHFSFFGDSKFIAQKLRALNYHSRRTFFIFRFLDFLFPSRLSRHLQVGDDLFYRDKLYKIKIKDYYPKDLLILLNRYPQYFYADK